VGLQLLDYYAMLSKQIGKFSLILVFMVRLHELANTGDGIAILD
jgi:hypothetical protein